MIISHKKHFLLLGLFCWTVLSSPVEEKCSPRIEEGCQSYLCLADNPHVCSIPQEPRFSLLTPPHCSHPVITGEVPQEPTRIIEEDSQEEGLEEVEQGEEDEKSVLISPSLIEEETPVPPSDETHDEGRKEDTLGQTSKQALPRRFQDLDYSIRMNFASSLLGAKVLEKNPGSMGARNLLNDDRDKCLLNVCNKNQPHYVVFELSQEILLDSIVIANYEYYASGLKNFRLYGSRSYPCRDPSCNWKWIGDFQLNNTRHSQSVFPNSKPYVQFLRIEFLSYYGNEFYCTLSTFRVHGSTLLEDLNEGESYGGENNEAEAVLNGLASTALTYRSPGGTEYVMVPRHMMQPPYAVSDQESLKGSLRSFRPEFEDITIEDSSTENVFKRMLQRSEHGGNKKSPFHTFHAFTDL
jgi:hypothetical protein